MVVASRLIIIVLISIILFFIGGVFLQIFLSKRESKWAGLFLPIITFSLSLLNIFQIADTGRTSQNVLAIILVLVISNIPTFIFLAIYFACREKIKRKSELDKMNIQDLD